MKKAKWFAGISLLMLVSQVSLAQDPSKSVTVYNVDANGSLQVSLTSGRAALLHFSNGTNQAYVCDFGSNPVPESVAQTGYAVMDSQNDESNEAYADPKTAGKIEHNGSPASLVNSALMLFRYQKYVEVSCNATSDYASKVAQEKEVQVQKQQDETIKNNSCYVQEVQSQKIGIQGSYYVTTYSVEKLAEYGIFKSIKQDIKDQGRAMALCTDLQDQHQCTCESSVRPWVVQVPQPVAKSFGGTEKFIQNSNRGGQPLSGTNSNSGQAL